MNSSYTSQSGALIDNVCLYDAAHRHGEDTRVDGGCGAGAHSALKTVAAVQEEEISVVTFPWHVICSTCVCDIGLK